MTPDELKQMIGNVDISDYCGDNVIETGRLKDNNATPVKYQIAHGWDMILSYRCDQEWQAFNLVLFEFISSKDYTKEEREGILSGIQTQDSHWDWFKKSCVYRTDEYEWFYLLANGKPQGACLFYHPKDSLFDSKDIFYIEFIAVAPWNRDTPLSEREFKGVGTLLIKCALNYAVNNLGLHYGFSLHSLPQAIDYYQKIGMTHFPERDKKHMPYFEMPRDKSSKLLGEL